MTGTRAPARRDGKSTHARQLPQPLRNILLISRRFQCEDISLDAGRVKPHAFVVSTEATRRALILLLALLSARLIITSLPTQGHISFLRGMLREVMISRARMVYMPSNMICPHALEDADDMASMLRFHICIQSCISYIARAHAAISPVISVIRPRT